MKRWATYYSDGRMYEEPNGDYVEYAEIEQIKRILADPGTDKEKIAAIAEMVE